MLGCVFAPGGAEAVITPGTKSLPLPGESFQLDGHEAFVILPEGATKDVPWVWYAPTLKGLPAKSEVWMFERFLKAGIAIAGIDVGESYGSPTGRGIYDAFYAYLVEEREFGAKPVLLARSRGGLMLYSWAIGNPQSVGGVAGIYPVCNIASYPGVGKAAGAYGMTAAELEAALSDHNPIDRLKPLAEAKVPILHLHGDNDKVVPLEANSALLAERYKALGGPVEVEVIKGQGHNGWSGWFESQRLCDFVIARAGGGNAKAADPVLKAGERVTLHGVLTGGLVAIGGETTGWQITYPTSKGPKKVEVALRAIKEAGDLDGADVTITGTIISKDYVERGPTLILKAESIVRKEDGPGAGPGEVQLPGLAINVAERFVDVESTVCLDRGLLELVACTKETKEHEAIVAIAAKAVHVHTALLLLGAESGTPAQRKLVEGGGWVDLPPTGSPVAVSLVFADAKGAVGEHPISEFLGRAEGGGGGVEGDSEEAGKFPTNIFLFSGSHLVGEDAGPRRYLADQSGDVITLSTFGDELLCLPGLYGQENGALMWELNSTGLPAVGTKVILRLRPQGPRPE